MKLKQEMQHNTIDQDQYIKTIVWTIDYNCHLSVLVAISIGEAEYILSAAVSWMRAIHLRILVYVLKILVPPFMM